METICSVRFTADARDGPWVVLYVHTHSLARPFRRPEVAEGDHRPQQLR